MMYQSPQEAGIELFAQSLRRGSILDLTITERKATERIVISLGYNQVAIRVVGAYAADLQLNLDTLAAELEANVSRLETSGNEALPAVKLVLTKAVESLPVETRDLFTALSAFSTEEFGRQVTFALGQALELSVPEMNIDHLIGRGLIGVARREEWPEESDRDRLLLPPQLKSISLSLFACWPEQKRIVAYRAIAQFYIAYTEEMPPSVVSEDEANITGALGWAQQQQESQLVLALCAGMLAFWNTPLHFEAGLQYIPWGLAAAKQLHSGQRDNEGDLATANLALIYGSLLHYTGQVSEIETHYTHALTIFRCLEEGRGEYEALAVLGSLAFTKGKYEQSNRFYQQALVIARELNDQIAEAASLAALGTVAQYGNQLEQAEHYLRQALSLARRAQDRSGEGESLSELGRIALLREQLAVAQEYYAQSLAIHRELGNQRNMGLDFAALGWIAQKQRHLQEAEQHYQKALEIARHLQDLSGEGEALRLLGLLAKQRGRFDDAEGLLQRSLEIARRFEDQEGEEELLIHLRELARKRGPLETPE